MYLRYMLIFLSGLIGGVAAYFIGAPLPFMLKVFRQWLRISVTHLHQHHVDCFGLWPVRNVWAPTLLHLHRKSAAMFSKLLKQCEGNTCKTYQIDKLGRCDRRNHWALVNPTVAHTANDVPVFLALVRASS